MYNIGIGTDCPTKRLHIVGFKRFDKLMIHIVVWICEKRNITVSFAMGIKKHKEPNHTLFI